MSGPTRLFDCIDIHIKDAPSRTMLAGKENGEWKEYSTVEVSEIVNKLSSGLLYAGVSPGDFTEEGRDKVGAILIPIYPTVSETDLEFILKDATVKIIFVNDQSLYEKVSHVKTNLPQFKQIVS